MVVRIPIVLTGTAEGVRNSGGILEPDHARARVPGGPAQHPGHIDVDVTDVAIGHSIHVSEITIPEGVEVLDDAGLDGLHRRRAEGRGGSAGRGRDA